MKTTERIARARHQLVLELFAVEEIRDLFRVQIHLGGMELKEAWHELEPRFFMAQKHAKRELAALGDAVLSLVVPIAEVRDHLRRNWAGRGHVN
jgi:hypothetical protein